MVHIEAINKDGQRIDEARLMEENQHPLLPGTIGSVVKELMGKNLYQWRSVTIIVK